MRISTKGRYAVRALIELATQEIDKPVMLSQIAHNQEIPQRYLIQIFSSLRKSGLVNSIRGAKGGFQLGKRASEITLEDIIAASEGPIELVACVPEKEEDCGRIAECSTRSIWQRVNNDIKAVFRKITLEEMVRLQLDFTTCRDSNYQI